MADPDRSTWPDQELPAPPRRAGRKAVINRDMIVAAARALPPQDITMQSVAHALGVDRKSLHYYVNDREGLLELVALDVFESEFHRLAVFPGKGWRELLRSAAYSMRAALVTVGSLLTYADLRGVGGQAVLAVHETILATLVESGFDLEEAGLAYTFISDLAYNGARDILISANSAKRPQTAEETRSSDDDLRAALADAGDGLPLLSRLVAMRSAANYSDRQFEFGLTALFSLLEALLADRLT